MLKSMLMVSGMRFMWLIFEAKLSEGVSKGEE
jgi:hypothetical protein